MFRHLWCGLWVRVWTWNLLPNSQEAAKGTDAEKAFLGNVFWFPLVRALVVPG